MQIIQYIPTSKLSLHPTNPRLIKDEAFRILCESIKNNKDYFETRPILCNKDMVIFAGNMRYRAAKEIGMTEVPTVIMDISEEKQREIMIRDNVQSGLWNENILSANWTEAELENFGVDLSQFGVWEPEPNPLDDEVPATPEAPVSHMGNLYQLGRHRLLVGDSTKPEDVARLMDGKKADMSFTSPPYNVGHNLGYEGKDRKYENSDDDLADYVGLITKSTRLALEYSQESFVNIQFLANNKKDIILWLADLADRFKDIFFWKKLQVAPQMADNVANNQVEIIVLFGHNNNRKWGNKRFHGNFSTYIETKSASGENKNAKIHNATFPVELPLKFITQGYEENSIVLDLFLGTGTTLIACEKTGRICYGMEIDPKYADVIIKRWESFTGLKAVLL